MHKLADKLVMGFENVRRLVYLGKQIPTVNLSDTARRRWPENSVKYSQFIRNTPQIQVVIVRP